jgi:nucleoporin NUP42
MRNALSNVDGAMDFIYKAENEHPNRNDICQASTNAPGSTGTSSGNPFGANNQAPAQAASGFGQPSVLGAKPNPFGAPQQAFGQPSMLGSAGTFGQPSALGQKPNPFGPQPGGAALAQGTVNTSGPFSAFATKSNPFGTPTQPAVANPFSQSAAPTENPFAQSGARPNPFGQPTSQSQSSPFASTVTSTPFGVPSSAAQRNPFGNISQSVQGSLSGPGLNQAPSPNPFGQPKPASPAPNPFAQSASTSSPNPFGQRPSSSAGSQSNPFAPSSQPAQAKVNGTASQGPYGPNAQFQHPPLESYVSKDSNQRLRMFKGKPVVYKENEPGIQNRDGTWEKIWFPDGPPAYYGATELNSDAYTEDTKQAYLHVRETGYFKDGVMPLLPPKREWCLWDF